MVLIRCLKPKNLLRKDFGTDHVQFPDSSTTMKLLGFINDTYKVDSIENMTRQKQGTSCIKFNNTGFEQNMPEGKNWKELLNTKIN